MSTARPQSTPPPGAVWSPGPYQQQQQQQYTHYVGHSQPVSPVSGMSNGYPSSHASSQSMHRYHSYSSMERAGNRTRSSPGAHLGGHPIGHLPSYKTVDGREINTSRHHPHRRSEGSGRALNGEGGGHYHNEQYGGDNPEYYHHSGNDGLKFQRANYAPQQMVQGGPPSLPVEGHPAGFSWETSGSQGSCHSDYTHQLDVCGTGMYRSHHHHYPQRPSSAQNKHHSLSPQNMMRRSVTPNPSAMLNRGDAWYMEEEGSTLTDFGGSSGRTIGHMDHALLPPKHYFPNSPTTHTHNNFTYGGPDARIGVPHSHVGTPYKRHSYADSTTSPTPSRSSSGSRRSSYDESATLPSSISDYSSSRHFSPSFTSGDSRSRTGSPMETGYESRENKPSLLRRISSFQHQQQPEKTSRRIMSVHDHEAGGGAHGGEYYVTDHMTSPTCSGSEKVRPRRYHQYDEVRPRHKYEEVADPIMDPSKASLSRPGKDKHIKRNASDSKLSRFSTKRHSAKDSPSAGKRMSTMNPAERNEERESIKKQNRISSPEVQLERMRQRYFPDEISQSNGVFDNYDQDNSPDVTSDSEVALSHKRNGKSKSTGSAMLHKIAKKLGKLNLGSGNGDSTGGAERNGKDSTGSMKKKRRRSRSVSNLDSTLGPNHLSRSMEHLSPIGDDLLRDAMKRTASTPGVTPVGTPTGTPKLSRSTSKTRLGRRGSEPDLEGTLSTLFRSGSKKNLATDPLKVLFDNIEQDNLLVVEQLLEAKPMSELQLPNDDGFLPLDLAAMLNHQAIAKLLLKKGARDSAKFFRDPFSRFSRIEDLLRASDHELEGLKYELVTQNASNKSAMNDLEQRLRKWEWKTHLLKKMRTTYQQAAAPGPPRNVKLHVTSNRTLSVTYDPPDDNNGAVVTRYKIEWCRKETFSPVVGEFVLTDLRTAEYTIPDLNKGEQYYVRVSAYNIKGFGPTQLTNPTSAVPSSWHDIDGSKPRYEGSTDKILVLSAGLGMTLSQVSFPADGQSSSGKTTKSVKKGITKLFGSAVKFHKSLKAGVYLASMVYSDEGKILVTVDDHIPIVEVSDSHTASIGSDFVWLAKVACTWEHIRAMCDISDKFTSSPAVQFRNKLLHTILDLQGALGMQDLGLLHPVPYKDNHGAHVFVIGQYVKEAKAMQAGISLKWTNLPRLWKKKAQPVGELETLPVPDQIVFDAQEIIAHHKNSFRPMASGLYLGYLKARSSITSMKVICSREYPNVLPHIKIRDNCNISSEEWMWLNSLSSPSSCPFPSSRQPHMLTSGAQSLQYTLLPTIDTFLHNLGISKEEVEGHQLYCHEAIELNEKITILLLMPPHEQVCTPPGSTDHFDDLPGFVALPINTFEIMQLYTYQKAFMTTFSEASARLEVELITSQQRMREAFSNEALSKAKQLQTDLNDFQERADTAWKEMRWIEDALQKGRDTTLGVNTLLPVKMIREAITKQNEQRELAMRRAKQEAPLMPSPSQRGAAPTSGYLRVFPDYTTGLVKGTSVKLYITIMTTTNEVIRLVVHQLEKARIERNIAGTHLTEEDLTDFYLVAISGNKEWVLHSEFNPLQMQSQMSKCRLYVRRRSEEIHAEITSV